MLLIDKYLTYISTERRYSSRTCEIYSSVLSDFCSFVDGEPLEKMLERQVIRAYQIHLLDDKSQSPRTVNLHLSVLSGLCRYLVREGVLKSNPVALVSRPKEPKRLPVFFHEDAMQKYLDMDNALSRKDFELELPTNKEKKDTYRLCLNRIIVCLLYSTAMRRGELIGLKFRDFDPLRGTLTVHGKGDKMREIPLLDCVVKEIFLYLHSVDKLVLCNKREAADPLLVTHSGGVLYPNLVDKAVKEELGALGREFSGRKSPHVLRHSLATALMEEGADLNSIKEVLGHSNLAATQIYTHSSIRQLKNIYEQAHPRATRPGKATNKGGNHGN